MTFSLLVRTCVIVWLSLKTAAGEEAFHVVVPDAAGRCVRLIQIAGDGASSAESQRVSLGWVPSGIAVDPATHRVVVTGRQAAQNKAATLILSERRLQVQQQSDLKSGTGYTSVDRSGRYLLSASYRDGRADVYRLSQDGRIGPRTATFSTPTQAAHAILTTRDNRFAYVPCVKDQNALYQFAFDDRTGSLTPLRPFDARPPAMFGPRHYVFHPQRELVYFSNEQQLGVSVFQVESDGRLQALQHATTRPRRAPWQPGVRGLHASDLVLDTRAERLFVAVRDFVHNEDSVYVFCVMSDGRLQLTGRTLVGDIPWKLDVSPDGRHLLVSESGDRALGIYRIGRDGGLELAHRMEWGMAARDFAVVP